MKPIIDHNTIKKIFYGIGALGGINLIIFIHEMGHFLCAKMFNVSAISFSLGFGPALYELSIGKTIFRLSLLPLGGYVELDPQVLARLTYLPHMLILLSGILFNLIFAYIILIYYKVHHQLSSIINSITPPDHATSSRFIGPIGIIVLIGKSLATSTQSYWFILAILSLNVGLFNILPLPFFDGGKALILTIETITGTPIPGSLLWVISTIIFALFIALIARITAHDFKQLLQK